MGDVGIFLQELEMIEHRVIGRKIELADHAHRVMPCLDARELDADLGVKQLAARETAQKIEMPPGAAKLSVGRKLQANGSLLVHDFLDLHILDLAQIVGRDLALLMFGASLLDAGRTQQAADLVGAERRSCSLHGITPTVALWLR